MPETIEYRLTAETRPFDPIHREIGCVNVGVYCANPKCGEFLTFVKESNPDFHYKVVAEKPLLVKCDHCHRQYLYPPDQIERVLLTTQNIRFPSV